MSWTLAIRAAAGALELDVALQSDGAPLAITGPNGSGKSTLLRVLAGAEQPRSGRIEVAGRVLLDSERGIDVPSEARRIGYVPQGYGLFPHLNALDNVAFGLKVGRDRRRRRERRHIAAQMLAELGVHHLAERSPARLSGGEQQRVALARALVMEPQLLLLDEPLAALDSGARRAVRRFLVERLRSLGLPSIVVTHDIRDAIALDAHVCVLERGRVVQQGDVASLMRAPASDFMAELVGVEPADRPLSALVPGPR